VLDVHIASQGITWLHCQDPSMQCHGMSLSLDSFIALADSQTNQFMNPKS
jgi:hypothetical protein